MAALATVSDIEDRLGRSLTATETTQATAFLDDASAAIRAYTGRQFEAGVSRTERLSARCGRVYLSHMAASITTVATYDGTSLSYSWDGLRTITVSVPSAQFDLEASTVTSIDVVYVLDDAANEAVAAVAVAMAARALGTPLDGSGLVQESIDGYSYRLGQAAAGGGVGMLPDERRLLDRFRPRGGMSWLRLSA